ncbi:KDO2-lipid IV(A) lauroyltransferase [Arachidicoccus rhizosphaerae]|uniref:KDO2-lipid IV(A) lauroyltransferase n=1 Tax=Arachidicoccus rhizosphaerae TaxID=551991 RepID=A0A1H3WWP3_9BACT|nr:hypothetical protein [Arachidicoccus rhizosphaerae]SDZ91559.1 KDO2-lipid IV(A) lauroyltransferase [Arachidicoccus rhizosphaerae]
MYYLVYGLLYLISLLPFRVLYGISDLAAFILHRIIRYRKPVVLHNLQIAFPEKTAPERKAIAEQFYYRFTDNFVELIKLISLPAKAIRRRFHCEDALLKELYQQGLSVDFVLGHFFNWEWCNLAYSLNNPYTQLVVYAHVSSPVAQRLMQRIRVRFGTVLIDSKKFKEQYKPYASERKAFVLVADQNPRFLKSAYWLPFFGRLTPFAKGPDANSRLMNNAVVYCSIKRIKRGYYTTRLSCLTRAAGHLPKGSITLQTAALLEKTIEEDPPGYLWSHRRFKHTYTPERDQRNLLTPA